MIEISLTIDDNSLSKQKEKNKTKSGSLTQKGPQQEVELSIMDEDKDGKM